MAADRRTVLLASAFAIVIVVAAVVWISGGSGAGSGQSLPPRAPARGQAADPSEGSPTQSVGHINLEGLKVTRTEPVDAGRNPFRFQARTPPALPSTSQPQNQGAIAPPTPPLPTGPPPPPPILLKFIGIVTQGTKRVAVLSDGKSAPQWGEEGAIILGQYRILRIGNESIEMAYLDGRGRQTIRLTGQ